MPLEPQRANDPDGKYNLNVVIPGWLKNQIVDHCKKLGVSIQDWVGARLLLDIREERGLPAAPEAEKDKPFNICSMSCIHQIVLNLKILREKVDGVAVVCTDSPNNGSRINNQTRLNIVNKFKSSISIEKINYLRVNSNNGLTDRKSVV